MPKVQRTTDEINAVKAQILKQAVDLMNRVGYQDFSMRGLARVIKVTPPTLYSYFHSKDELYLCILTEGFDRLYNICRAAYQSFDDPIERIRAMVKAYLDFGLKCANFYNLMFTWHVPKYKDYLGTPLEQVAEFELVTSLRVTNLFLQAIKECADDHTAIIDEDARFYLVHFWSALHGYIAGYNNTLLDYMHESPISIKERTLNLGLDTFVRELETRGFRKPGRMKAGIMK